MSETVTVELDPRDAELVEFAARTSGCDSVADYLRGAALLTAVQRCRHVEESVDDSRADKARELGEEWAERQPGDFEFETIEP